MRTTVTPKAQKNCRAFSLVEMIVTVLVIGMMTGIMIKTYQGVRRSSSRTVANDLVEVLNSGVKKYSQGAETITTAADDNLIANEATILGLLQTRDNTLPGSPFVRPDWNPVASSVAADYRIEWGGRMFHLLEPGTAGTGLKVDFDAADYD